MHHPQPSRDGRRVCVEANRALTRPERRLPRRRGMHSGRWAWGTQAWRRESEQGLRDGATVSSAALAAGPFRACSGLAGGRGAGLGPSTRLGSGPGARLRAQRAWGLGRPVGEGALGRPAVGRAGATERRENCAAGTRARCANAASGGHSGPTRQPVGPKRPWSAPGRGWRRDVT